VLPDGSKSFIPAAWTDLDGNEASSFSSKKTNLKTIGSIAQMLHTRKVVDALLNRLDFSKHAHTNVRKEESIRATSTMASRPAVHSEFKDLGRSRPPS
jgi:hypothetical protein